MATSYVSIEHAAKELAMSERTLRSWVGKGLVHWQWDAQLGGRVVDLDGLRRMVATLNGRRLTPQFFYGEWARERDGE